MTTEDFATEHETALIDSFIIRDRRERYRSQLSSHKKRGAFLDRLNHRFMGDLDERYVCDAPTLSIPSDEELCYIVACEDKYDGRVVSVSAAANILRAAYFGVVVSYRPGTLAAYKDEAPAKIVWMERKQ